MSLGMLIFFATSEVTERALPMTVYCDKPRFLTDLSQYAMNDDALPAIPLSWIGFGFEAQSPIPSFKKDTSCAVVCLSITISASYNTMTSPADLLKISFQPAAAPLLSQWWIKLILSWGFFSANLSTSSGVLSVESSEMIISEMK
jgi:hypothetical protein